MLFLLSPAHVVLLLLVIVISLAFRTHKPSTQTPERITQHVERTEYRRPGTHPLSSHGHPIEILACISARGPPRLTSTLPHPLLPFLFRRYRKALPTYGSFQVLGVRKVSRRARPGRGMKPPAEVPISDPPQTIDRQTDRQAKNNIPPIF
ncbi:hypothetical protein DPMN_108383 [Dreissena polymorpha]|uniref:Secreted protein n=1 Tax=Dreissena polymorpha TaxID=45954 RepID=A0A9D4K8R4_DREPO|nr:hypothetical protein DPMN_108383 [Dreissena polymorpha]